MNANPKVSVLMPSLNVSTYIQECIESVINQTLQDIEIICIDAGSTDGTLEILQEYAAKDDRIQIILSDKKSYGYQMNLGLNAATGEYIGIVETDDYIVPKMYETLYQVIKLTGVDIVKADYYNVYGQDENLSQTPCKVIEDTTRYERIWNPKHEPWIFYVPMMNCLGLFESKFLKDNKIRHNETPGASHQDMGFWFQTFCLAQSIYFYAEPFYCYRQDNTNSSINSHTKVYCVQEEYKFMMDFLNCNAEIKEWVMPIFYHRMFGSYFFTYKKLADYLKPLFLKCFADEFNEYQKNGELVLQRFSVNEKSIVNSIMQNPMKYFFTEYRKVSGKDYKAEYEDLVKQINDYSKNLDWYKKELDFYRSEITRAEAAQVQGGPIVTIIIPVYNTAKYLKECLDSIIGQTLKNIEIICVNDGSIDNSQNILEEFAAKDSRMTIFKQQNMGQSAARNAALKYAQGKYIYFMDSDDRLNNEALQSLSNKADSMSLDVLYFDGLTFFDSEQLEKQFSNMKTVYQRSKSFQAVYTGLELFTLFKSINSYRVSPCLQLINLQYLRDKSFYFPEGIIYEDNLFNFKCLLSAQRVSHCNIPYFERRIRDNSTTISELQFRNFYGYYFCYLQMLFFVLNGPESLKNNKTVLNEIDIVRNAAFSKYSGLPKGELDKFNKMSDLEIQLFKKLILNPTTVNLTNPPQSGQLIFLEHKLVEAQQEVQNIYKSISYRVGRAITFLPRKIRGGVRCLQEHGIKYTLHRVKCKFLRRP